jgi:hypothetical protein
LLAGIYTPTDILARDADGALYFNEALTLLSNVSCPVGAVYKVCLRHNRQTALTISRISTRRSTSANLTPQLLPGLLSKVHSVAYELIIMAFKTIIASLVLKLLEAFTLSFLLRGSWFLFVEQLDVYQRVQLQLPRMSWVGGSPASSFESTASSFKYPDPGQIRVAAKGLVF